MRKKLTPRKKWRFWLMRWHRRLGVTVSFIVLWLCVTGILLNHSDQLRLNSQSIGPLLLSSLYGVESPTPVSFQADDHWVSHLGGNHVYLDGVEVAFCRAPFSGAVWYHNQFVVSCGEGLLLLTSTGEVLERLGTVYGIPQPISALAVVEDLLLLNTIQGIINVDIDKLDWQPYPIQDTIGKMSGHNDGAVIVKKRYDNISDEKKQFVTDRSSEIPWAMPQKEPETLTAKFVTSVGGGVTWERLILDMHNGRLIGRLGVWLLDISAIFLIVLAASGVWIWSTSPSR